MGQCHKSEKEPITAVGHKLRKHKEKIRKPLTSEKVIKRRKQRPWDIEGTFGILKSNKGFKRVTLRGLKNIEIEARLISITQNIAKMSEIDREIKKQQDICRES